jgi:hypothetical protein
VVAAGQDCLLPCTAIPAYQKRTSGAGTEPGDDPGASRMSVQIHSAPAIRDSAHYIQSASSLTLSSILFQVNQRFLDERILTELLFNESGKQKHICVVGP